MKRFTPTCIAAVLVVSCGSIPQSEENVTSSPSLVKLPSDIAHPPTPSGVSGANEAPLRKVVKPSAEGDADTSGMSPEQIETMFAAAFAQQRPFDDHQAVCLVIVRAEGGGWPRNPPAHALAAFTKWTDLPVLPGSSCAFGLYDVHPVVIDSGARAMLYSIRIENIARDGTVTFWGNATFGNLGAKGAEFVLRRRGNGWLADATGVSAIS
jgi:hypothetical protein